MSRLAMPQHDLAGISIYLARFGYVAVLTNGSMGDPEGEGETPQEAYEKLQRKRKAQ